MHDPPEDLLDWGPAGSCRLSAKTRQRRTSSSSWDCAQGFQAGVWAAAAASSRATSAASGRASRRSKTARASESGRAASPPRLVGDALGASIALVQPRIDLLSVRDW